MQELLTYQITFGIITIISALILTILSLKLTIKANKESKNEYKK